MVPADRATTHLQIGVITRPHGVRGELKVRLHHEGSTALHDASHVVLEGPRGEAQRLEIESVRGNSKTPILALLGIEGREAADGLRGQTIWVERSALAPLDAGEYYLIDLIGCEVEFNGAPYARVIAVRPDPTVDTMVVQLSGGKTAEVPLVDAWVGNVSIAERRVELLSTDGVIEE